MEKKFLFLRSQKYKPRRTFFSHTDLEGILETIKVEISQIPITNNTTQNFSLSERKALRQLKCNSDLVVNKADKKDNYRKKSAKATKYIKLVDHY